MATPLTWRPLLKTTRRAGLWAFLAAAVASSSGQAATWTAELLNLPGPLTEVRQADGSVYLRAGGWIRLDPCDGGLCRVKAEPPRRTSAADGIPHGFVATGDGGIARAWYTRPTDRYGHGVLGDRIEAGALAVVVDGKQYDHLLGNQHVFEDLAPRIADLDGDGLDEVVAIRSDVGAGAALAVYRVGNNTLAEAAVTDAIGRANRWLNVAGIADYTGDGQLDVATVVTPHIGGRLDVWTMADGDLVRVDAARGFSNHAIGSTELGLSATADVNGDGVPDLAVPSANRSTLRIVTARGGAIVELAKVPVGGQIVTAIGVLDYGGRPVFVLGLDNGSAVAVSSRG